MMNPIQFDLLLEERRREVERAVETQRMLRLLAPTRPHLGRRCCAQIGVRLQQWGLRLQAYAAQGQAPAWKEQIS